MIPLRCEKPNEEINESCQSVPAKRAYRRVAPLRADLGNSHLLCVRDGLRGLMHFYPFHIGDYRAATAHLSDAEDLAYRRLLDMYYDNEKPIPLDTSSFLRRLRSPLKETEAVLCEFFIKTDAGWIHKRADQEIEHYQGRREKASIAGKASARRRLNAGSTDVEQTLNERQPTKNQEPRTSNQESNNTRHDEPTEQPVTQTAAGQWAVSLRAKGIEVTSIHPTLLAWISDGFTLPAVLESIELARMQKPTGGIAANYLDAIVRAPPKKQVDRWWDDRQKTMDMAKQFGIATIGKEANQLQNEIKAAMRRQIAN